MNDDPSWYQRAIFYEVLVRGFRDSNGDGTGDLRGITEKLDYLEWLGVDCLWLLPFYSSPLKDGGYDISDFFTVLPDYGTVGDAAELIDEAHRRGIRVIADMAELKLVYAGNIYYVTTTANARTFQPARPAPVLMNPPGTVSPPVTP